MIDAPKVILVPIDSRPVTYSLPQLVALAAGLEAVVPPLALVGSQQAPTDLNQLAAWLEHSLSEVKPDALVVCLDAILYGGLVSSRRSDDSLEDVLKRAEGIAHWKKIGPSRMQVLAQASIMRIPHYDGATGEPEYWQQYGEKIFQWSVLLHKDKLEMPTAKRELAILADKIPLAVRQDFLHRRERNFQVNQSLVGSVKSGQIDYLVFSQDDTKEFGLNVWEKAQLSAQAKAANLSNIALYPGTDEVIMTLMARWLIGNVGKKPVVCVHFSPDCGKRAPSNFEGQTIEASCLAQARALGLHLAPPGAGQGEDFTIIIHTACERQGDHISLNGACPLPTEDTGQSVQSTLRLLQEASAPVVLCDVAYSNGSDPLLVEALFSRKDLLKKLCAYAGWNTTGNTIGSALAMGTAGWYARLHDFPAQEALKRLLFVRFADDWAYQALVRHQLAGQASQERLAQLMEPLLKRLANELEFDPGHVCVRLPWNRTFEVEIAMSQPRNNACAGKPSPAGEA